MFSSIRWKFISVYFLLVFIAMVIVGIFIIGKLETQQISNIVNNMEQNIETIIGASSYIAEDDWMDYQEEIQETLNEWRLGSSDTLYLVYEDQDVPTIIASTSRQYNTIIGQNALSYKFLETPLILEAYEGEKVNSTLRDIQRDTPTAHVAYPVLTELGKIKGVFYMTSDLHNVYVTVNESKKILTNATLMALSITVLLGFIIASSITEPIRDVTKKAEEMAKGDFEQLVTVKSDDEIGQLSSMFNYLTIKLKDTLQEMDLEKSKLDTIFNYMAEGVIAIDRNGHIIHANPIAMDILNLGEEDIKNQGGNDPNIFKLDSVNLNKINYGNAETLEGDETLKKNSQVFKLKYAPFKNERNDIGGLIIVFQDITKEHKLDIMRKEFVANVSHELKTPITTIKSYTETLMGDGIKEETKNKFLNVIDTECDRMTRLVRDLLQLSNLDYKKTSWNKVEVSVNKLLKDILSKLDFAFKDKNHEIISDIQEDMENIIIDKDSIEQVILNIISNAIKYTEEGGKIKIQAKTSGDYISISVEDNGLGIPFEDQKRIFERFYRVEKGRSRDLGGTGLGLAIAKQIVQAHDGEILLHSEYGKGTRVEVKLPYVEV